MENLYITIYDLIIFLLGLLLGNWLAIGRDKRKEFNQIADDIYLNLYKEKKALEISNNIPRGPDYDSLETLKRRSSFLKKRALLKVVQEYKKAKSSKKRYDSANQPISYETPEVLIESIEKLIKKIERK
ncbi:MAG: hypothetical protein ABJI69_11215 [Balneola sp.]